MSTETILKFSENVEMRDTNSESVNDNVSIPASKSDALIMSVLLTPYLSMLLGKTHRQLNTCCSGTLSEPNSCIYSGYCSFVIRLVGF